MAQIIDGKKIAAEIRAELAKEIEELKKEGLHPGLAVILVGDDPASRVYVNNKKKACAEIGIYSREYALPKETTQEELLNLIGSSTRTPDPASWSSCLPDTTWMNARCWESNQP